MFGPGGSVLVSDVHCSGTEQKLHLCPITERSKQHCNRNNRAGVICSRSIGTCHNYFDLLLSYWSL